jgi:hypothetical protein
MGAQLFFLVDMIKKRINQNDQTIKENEEVIKNILLDHNYGDQTEIISKTNLLNRKLRAENIDLIRIQEELVDKLDEFKEVVITLIDKLSDNQSQNYLDNILQNDQSESYSISLDDQSNSDDQLFAQTVKGELVYESSHPKFDDPKFYEKLFNYYKDVEYYEMCNHLLLLKGKR